MTDSIRLDGKVAIVTGAAQGLGAEMAALLARRGAAVVVADVDEAGRQTAEAVGGLFMRLDVSSEEQWEGVVAATLAAYGKLNILVNNAGIFTPNSVLETDPVMLERMFRVNVLGTMLGMRFAHPALAASTGPSIVNISSCVAMRGTTNQSSYAATKWAVRGVTKCAALEFASDRIRVNSVHPGPSETSIMDPWGQEQIESIKAMIPLGRLGKPIESAEVVAFLASDSASYISGAEITVDGAVFA